MYSLACHVSGSFSVDRDWFKQEQFGMSVKKEQILTSDSSAFSAGEGNQSVKTIKAR